LGVELETIKVQRAAIAIYRRLGVVAGMCLESESAKIQPTATGWGV
jgi:hypothetical protein